MKEVVVLSPQLDRNWTGIRSIGLGEFLATWRIGGCSWVLTVIVIGLHSAASTLMAALLFVIRNMVELEQELADIRSLIVIVSACGLLLTYELIVFAAGIIGGRHGVRVFETLRQKIFSHLLYVPLPILEKNPVGEWIARCENDTRAIRSGLLSIPGTVTHAPLAIAIYLGAIIWQSSTVGAVIVLWLILGVLPAVLFRHKMFKLSQQILQRAGNLTGRLSETFMSIRTVKSLCAEAKEDRAVRDWIESHIRLSYKTQLIAMGARQLSAIAMGVCFLTVALFGRHKVIQGSLALGELVAILIGIVLLSRELRNAAGMITSLQSFSAAARRYLETLALPTEPMAPESSQNLPCPIPDLIFHHVSFAYEEGMPLLRELNFTVQRGETMAVVGLSGTGKSTLIDMVIGLRRPEHGEIRAAGRNINSYHLGEWRKRIGVVFQQPRLFSGTVRRNLLEDDSPVTTQELWEGLREVHLDRMIRSRPGAENAEVRETGNNWSEGEVQRLVLLRTLFRKPEILLLDEPTSALDARAEQAVMRLLKKYASERITLIITHRMALALQADRVVVIGPGSVEGIGTPEELYEHCPLFGYMCLAQHVAPSDKSNRNVEKSNVFTQTEYCPSEENR